MVQATRCNVARFYCALKSCSVRIFVTNYWYQRVDVSVYSHISTHMSNFAELLVHICTMPVGPGTMYRDSNRNVTLDYCALYKYSYLRTYLLTYYNNTILYGLPMSSGDVYVSCFHIMEHAEKGVLLLRAQRVPSRSPGHLNKRFYTGARCSNVNHISAALAVNTK